jgi:ferric-dicitrate binding protein FerR (iron transport regulator)
MPGEKVEVKVTRGRVQVSHLDKILSILIPAQAITYDEQKNEAKLEYKIDTAQIQLPKPMQEWRWQEAKLADVTAWLETHFNTHINIADEHIKQEVFSASFPEPLSLQDVLEVISKVYGLNIKQLDNGDYVLSIEK